MPPGTVSPVIPVRPAARALTDTDAPFAGLYAYDLLDTPPERGFDDVVLLARQICDAPIALVSLLDRDRQWFKARSGFPLCETELDRSVCRFVVEADAAIEIPDLTLDPRTSANALVVGEPFVRFYAGAPLQTPRGTIGALCILDDQPRPDGLSATQRSALFMLARQVVDIIELRDRSRLLEEAERARAVGERSWRSLFETIEEGFVLATLQRDNTGRVHDWRYEQVNPAWGRLMGLPPEDAVGASARALFPGLEEDWIADFARVVETGRASRFTRRLGQVGRWYEGTAQRVDADRFTFIFREVTERVLATRRQEGLLALGDLFHDEHDVSRVLRDAATVIARALDASRAAYGELDHTIETVVIAEGWDAPGLPPLAGRYRFDDYGRLRETLLAGQPLVIADIDTDPRTAADAASWHALHTRAVVNLPVREGGRTVAVLLVHHDHPHVWTEAELAWLRNAAERVEVAIARRRAEERQAIVNGEIAHRLKNTLSMVQAIAALTLRRSLPPEDLARFSERLQAMARAHELLLGGSWHAADLHGLVTAVMDDIGAAERCRVSGPPVRLGARAAMSTALVLHELCTNAGKHGALSTPDGAIAISWALDRAEAGDGTELVLDWRERGGPPARPPGRTGFGSRLLSLGLLGTGGSELRYEPTGLEARFRADAVKMEQA